MGPLAGIKIVEFAGIAPGPFCGMMLADMGAEVIRIDRHVKAPVSSPPVAGRGKHSITVNLKDPDGIQLCLDLIKDADAVIEGYRPGVIERLGLGPDVCMALNPRLVYGRVTGWGQDGPMALAAGHDLNYIAISGALHAFGLKGGKPVMPANILGDFAAGGMFLLAGMLAALLETKQSGKGQVIDTAMSEGAAMLMTFLYASKSTGGWEDARGTNSLDGGSHYYNTYECADGRYLSVGAMEPQFYATLLADLGIDDPLFAEKDNKEKWPLLQERMAEVILTKSRDEWCEIFEGHDACVAPVLSMSEAPHYPQNVAREAFIPAQTEGEYLPAPHPKFSRTPQKAGATPVIGEHTDQVLKSMGYDDAAIATMRENGTV